MALQGVPTVIYQSTPDATFGPQSPLGIFTINATFINTGAFQLHGIYYQVTRLDNNNYLLDATGGPGQVAARQLIAEASLPGGNQQWDAHEILTSTFRIGLAERRRFGFLVEVYGLVDASRRRLQPAARDTRLGSFYFEYDPNDFVAHGVGEQTIFLPLLMR